MGGTSKVLLQSGTFCPFVHRQAQSAFARETGRSAANAATATMAAILMTSVSNKLAAYLFLGSHLAATP
jgi:hypothetical protein